MRTNCVPRLGVLVLTGLLAVPALFGASYTYTKITDDAPGSTLGGFSFLGPFLINSSGAVAFTAAAVEMVRDLYRLRHWHQHCVCGWSYFWFASRVRGHWLQRFRHGGLLDRGTGGLYGDSRRNTIHG